MAVTLRLMRFGKKMSPFYRIVAIDKRKKRDGAYIEKVGQYNPMVNPAEVSIDKKKYEYWTSKGAQISEGLGKLLKNPKNVTFTE